MKNEKIKIIMLLAVVVALFGMGNSVFASEVTGRLSTGLSANNGETFDGTVIAPPSASPSAGVYTSAQSVILTPTAGTVSVHYTTNGTAPTCASGQVYSSAIPVNDTTTIEAISCYPNNMFSGVALFLYAINNPAATIPSGGSSGGGGGGGGGYIIQNTSQLSPDGQKVDFNHDGKIGIPEFVQLMIDWGKTGSGNSGDFNSDGKVDILDFVMLMANWTK